MEFLSSSQYNDKENIPPFSSEHPNSLPLACPSKKAVSKRTRRPLEDITNRFHPTIISASGSGSVPLLVLRRRTNCQSDARLFSAGLDLSSLLFQRVNLRKRKIIDDQNALQRSCRMSLRKDLR
ncbi:hypothetical protein MRB53_019889 [Persea americana]|uniref:Uncharacterized protein n=1 Tax=Persea americana TaxID=3435 RepID=A0ACC2L0F8_PERAE|nr:hypothetical protein MRB53_019889 [Persea americana]|eukprot:TRINITY_DN82199_c0_g1_i1.p1 TRINITY_DN82199_c0_g1~~TRINITY_DN82199_c0_g1_i1.p1  ORF type:complete len:144 (-),score=28.75 TRINITY_DN82199_c0_g1_i1:155-526(-)